MKIWTQADFDAHPRALTGWLELGSGDFSAVDFGGVSFVDIGEGSVLGPGVRLGEMVRIGRGTRVGEDFRARAFVTVGERCAFGEGARLGMGCKIGAHTRFDAGVEIGLGAEIGDLVDLPRACRLFGIPADGRTLVKIAPVCGRVLYAFLRTDGTAQTAGTGVILTLEDRERLARQLMASQEAAERAEGGEMMDACLYLAARLAGCGGRA